MIEFLTRRFNEGCSYSTLNADRSAIALVSDNIIGENNLVCRFVKGCFRLRPAKLKYISTWDVDIVFNYIEKKDVLSISNSLDLLSLKTVMLLALATAQRAQTLSKIRIQDIKVIENRMIIDIVDLIKTSRPGVKNPQLILERFADRPSLCVVSSLQLYLECTSQLRGEAQYLFI